MNENNMQQPWGAYPGYTTGFNGGQTFGAPAMPKMTNPLTDEERESLKHNNAFTLQVSQTELAAGICTHKDPGTGLYATVTNPDGSVTCNICHTTFYPDAVTEEYVKDHTNAFLNILETCKLLGVDLNSDVIRGVFQMTPFVKKIPELFKMSMSSFYRYNDQNPYANQVANPNNFAMLNNVIGGMPMMGQPVMGQQQYMQQPASPYMQPQQYMQQPQATPYMQQQSQMVNGGSAFYQTNQPQQQAPQQYSNMNPPQYQNMAQQPMNSIQVPGQTPAPQPAENKAAGQVEVNAQMGL